MIPKRNAEWKTLLEELEDSLALIAKALGSPRGSEEGGVEAGIRRGYCAFHNRRILADALGKHGVVRKWDQIVTQAMIVSTLVKSSESEVGAFELQVTQFLIKLHRAARDDSGEIAPSAHWQR